MLVLPPDARFAADFGWLQSRFLLSFAHHYDPENAHFGALRAFNDDLLAPRAGYPLHPHAEQEIVNIVLSGTLTHTGQPGHTHTVTAGEVLRLTAGTGLQHTEANRSANVPLHLYQLWFRPRERGLQPAVEQRALDFLTVYNAWTPLLNGGANALFLNADAAVWWANLDAGRALPFAVAAEQRAHLLYVAAGQARVNGQLLATNAQARLTNETHLTVEAVGGGAAVLLVEVW